MAKILLLWFGVFTSAAIALITAAQYLITPNVLAAVYIIKFRRYFNHFL